jgi:S1-C subfamily serine protease
MPRKALLSFLPLALAALAFVAPASAQSRAHEPTTWFVLVSHRLDLARDAQRMVSAEPDARVEHVGGPRFVINLTAGVLVDKEGHVVTRLVNLDPTSREQDLKITTSTGKVLKATFVGLDQPTGLAVLSVPGLRGVGPAVPAAAARLDAGTPVRVVTAVYSLRRVSLPTVERVATYPKLLASAGRVVVPATPLLARGGVLATVEAPTLTSSTDLGFVEAADGRLVGLVLYISPTRGNVVAVPFARDVVTGRVVEANGTVQSGWLGAVGKSISDVPTAGRPSWATGDGVLIQTISANGPADAAGLKRDDLVVGFDGLAVSSTNDLQFAIGATPAATRIELSVLRGGQSLTIAPVLGARPFGAGGMFAMTEAQQLQYRIVQQRQRLGQARTARERADLEREIEVLETRLASIRGENPAAPLASRLGLKGHTCAKQFAEVYGVPGCVQVEEVVGESAASAAGLIATDIIVRAGGAPVSTTEALEEAVRAAAGANKTDIELEVLREKKPVTVRVALSPLTSGRP